MRGWNSVSSTPLALNTGVVALQQEGYYLTLLPAHIVVHDVPYVRESGDVAEGKLIIPVTISGEQVTMPDHQIHFMGEFPYTATGVKMTALLADVPTGNEVAEGIVSNYRFSNKPSDEKIEDDCYKKVKHYEAIICGEAQVVDPSATARKWKPTDQRAETVFQYADTNAGRAGIVEQSNRLRQSKIGIIGLGGTGSYVLDLVAKTPVSEIHLFDGDVFENHNAFRAPGAAQVEALKQRLSKTDYFKTMYDVMRHGIHAHPYHVTEEKLSELDQLNFVFLCIDSGAARKLIAEYLRTKHIPFIDTGIDISNRSGQNLLEAITRATFVNDDSADEAMSFLSFGDINDGIYSTNVQIAEINALNACQAVIEWKKYVGFYADDRPAACQVAYYTQDNATVY